MWFINGSSQSKSNIDEANKHLNALYDKIEELERLGKEKDLKLNDQKNELEMISRNYEESRKEEQRELISRLDKAESRVRVLEKQLATKEYELQTLKQRHSLLNEVCKYKTALAKLTITLEQAEQYSHQHGLVNGLNSGYGQYRRDDDIICKTTDILLKPAIMNDPE